MLARLLFAVSMSLSAAMTAVVSEARGDELEQMHSSCLKNVNCAHAKGSSRLYTWRMICESNPACKAGEVDANGGEYFDVVRRTGSTEHMYCSSSGTCTELQPRGRRTAILNPVTILAKI